MSLETLNSLKEKALDRLPGPVRKYFPVRADSLEEYIELLKSRQATEVTGSLVIHEPLPFFDKTILRLSVGIITYAGRFSSTTGQPRELRYDNYLGSWYDAWDRLNDFQKRALWNLRSSHDISKQLEIIREEIPSIQTTNLAGKSSSAVSSVKSEI